jgi:hypothetical protein
MSQQRIWYVAYASNLAMARFRCYLSGGRPLGGAREYAGCRDQSEPSRTQGVQVPGGLVFAEESGVWGGGMAFYDHTAPGFVACRAFLVTAEQFGDVVAQERRLPPGGEFAEDLAGLLPDVESLVTIGPGHYETVVRLGLLDGVPMFTVTHHDVGSLRVAPPAAAYLHWIARGLQEAHGYDAARIAGYLSVAPGIRGAWSEPDLEAVAEGALAATVDRPPVA